MDDDIPMIDIISQIVWGNYLSEYNIESGRLAEIKAIKEPVIRRLAININKYFKAVTNDRSCLLCGKSTGMFSFTVLTVRSQESFIWIAYFLCKNHFKKLISEKTNNIGKKIQDLISTNNYDEPSKSLIHTMKQYEDVEEMSFGLKEEDLKLFAKNKNWNGYIIIDHIAERILYSSNKLSLLKFYTGFDEFDTSFRFVEHTAEEKEAFDSPGSWVIDNFFTFDGHGIHKYLNPSFTRNKIEAIYWDWVIKDISQRNGDFIDLSDKMAFNPIAKKKRIKH
jgi:hypothetical protein